MEKMNIKEWLETNFIEIFLYFLGVKRFLLFLELKEHIDFRKNIKEVKKFFDKVKKFARSNRDCILTVVEFGEDRKYSSLFVSEREAEVKAFVSLTEMPEADEKKMSEMIGKILDYPECCIKNYVEKVGDDIKNRYELTRDYIQESFSKFRTVRVFKNAITGLWLVGREFGYKESYTSPILGYVPCRPDCPRTLEKIDMVLHELLAFIIKLFREEEKNES